MRSYPIFINESGKLVMFLNKGCRITSSYRLVLGANDFSVFIVSEKVYNNWI